VVHGAEDVIGGVGKAVGDLAQGNLLGAAGDVVGGVVKGVEDVAGGVVKGIEDAVSSVGKFFGL